VPRISRWLALCFFAAGLASPAVAAEDGEAKVVKDGSRVTLEYTLKLEDGSVADTSEGREPLVFQQGAGEILPALEKGLAGLAVGSQKQIKLSAEEGYGPVREELYHTVAIEQIPEDARTVGSSLVAEDMEGNQRPVRVREVRGDEIVIDLNHPLAGQALFFDVKIVSID